MKKNKFIGEKYRAAAKHQLEWGKKIIDELKLNGNEKVLDLGCGDGLLTKLIAEKVPNGNVLGIDSSSSMIDTAQGIKKNNLIFVLKNITDINYENKFDIIYSNAALHWVKDHKSLLNKCIKALKVSGKIRFNFAGEKNCNTFVKVIKKIIGEDDFSWYFKELEWPWFNPSIGEYKDIIGSIPFRDVKVFEEIADRFFLNGNEMIRWIDQPALVPFIKYIPDEKKEMFRSEVINRMLKITKKEDGRCFEIFRRINIIAIK